MTLNKTQIAKFIFVGQGGPLSIMPLKRLLAKGYTPEAVIVPMHGQQRSRINLLPVKPPQNEHSLSSLATDAGLKLINWQKGYTADLELDLANILPDLVIMSCFPWRISNSLLEIPPLGWWNLHPSLLPAYRGPNPLYWQLKSGETETGISLHEVTSKLDAGPILGQKRCALSATAEIENQLGQLGGELLVEALQRQQQRKLMATPQNEALASYQTFPDQ